MKFACRLQNLMHFTVGPVGQRRIVVRLIHNIRNGPNRSGHAAHLDPAQLDQARFDEMGPGGQFRPRLDSNLQATWHLDRASVIAAGLFNAAIRTEAFLGHVRGLMMIDESSNLFAQVVCGIGVRQNNSAAPKSIIARTKPKFRYQLVNTMSRNRPSPQRKRRASLTSVATPP